ncbi:hypothetical protein HDV05_002207 [Chytridiales sp. JEL 0842]|nr:hypothetical protein HDV05_002207 [Chytridiales sp. JEL 0842]
MLVARDNELVKSSLPSISMTLEPAAKVVDGGNNDGNEGGGKTDDHGSGGADGKRESDRNDDADDRHRSYDGNQSDREGTDDGGERDGIGGSGGGGASASGNGGEGGDGDEKDTNDKQNKEEDDENEEEEEEDNDQDNNKDNSNDNNNDNNNEQQQDQQPTTTTTTVLEPSTIEIPPIPFHLAPLSRLPPPNTSHYCLIVLQQPLTYKPCGFGGDKTIKRPLDPCLIVQIGIVKETGEVVTSLSELGDVSFMIAHATLLFSDTQTPIPPSPSPLDPTLSELPLFGSLLSSAHYLSPLPPQSSKGAFFVFPDLNIRIEGKFRIKLTMRDLGGLCSQTGGSVGRWIREKENLGGGGEGAPLVAECVTDVVECDLGKDLMDLEESTELSQHFAEQGIRIPIRRKTKRRGSFTTDELE